MKKVSIGLAVTLFVLHFPAEKQCCLPNPNISIPFVNFYYMSYDFLHIRDDKNTCFYFENSQSIIMDYLLRLIIW